MSNLILDNKIFTDGSSGSNSLTPAQAASLYVPYTGATGTVNLGTRSLNAGAVGFSYSQVYASTGAATFFVQAIDPIQHSQYSLANEDSTVVGAVQLKNTTYGVNGIYISGGVYLESSGPRTGIINYGTGDIIFATGVYNPLTSPTIKLQITSAGLFQYSEGINMAFGTITGTKIGTTTSQKIGFFNKTPIIQPTTGITGAAYSLVGGTPISTNDTFGGYTLQQIAAIIINLGLTA